ncbi:hypothetical protein DFH09DRAFT_1143220 [Mycena vulgaris]|nr:hypothetical protein DFH09DRAFT_1143220 [Mycena vulgaris]
MPCHLARLPNEILLIVFRCALPPSWVLNEETSLPPFPQSVWSVDLRMKLCIIRVCKTWHRIGLELLYKTVTLRRIGQIPAFVSALEAHNGLGTLVRNLNISCFVPCGFVPAFLILDSNHPGCSPDPDPPMLPPAVGRNITSLEYNRTVEYDLIFPTLVELHGNLQSLALSLPTTYDASHPTLVFEKLVNLRVCLAVSEMPPRPRPKWTLPALRRLWIRGSRYLWHKRSIADVGTFLAVFGRSITFLWLNDFVRDDDDDDDIGTSVQRLLDRCPALEHLTTLLCLYEVEPPLQHQLLNSLDIFTPRGTLSLSQGGFTALRTLRIIDLTLVLAWDLVPAGLPDGDEGELSMLAPEEDLRETAWINAVLSTDPDVDDPSDDDYIFDAQADDGGSVDDSDSDDSDSDSDAASCITVGMSEDEGDEYDLEDELERDEALAIFRGLSQ